MRLFRNKKTINLHPNSKKDFFLYIMAHSHNMSLKNFLAILAFIFASGFVSAQQEHNQGEEKFDAGEMILEHVQDAHSWHLWGKKHSAVSVPLPIIVKTDKGIDMFSSSQFMDAEHMPTKVYRSEKTGYNYKLVHETVEVVNEDGSPNEELSKQAGLIDFSITKNVVSLLFGSFIMCWLFMSVAKMYKRRPGQAPKGIQNLVEPLIMFVRDDLAKGYIGAKHEKFLPFLLTVFFFIWINNLLGLIPFIPGGANLTGNISVTLILAGLVLIITLINTNGHYWRHVFAMPGVPVGVLAILTPIEILGVFLKPFVLMVRLFANITAGHIIALAFLSLIFIFGEMNAGAGLGVSVVSLAFAIFMFVMELLVAFLQAYVFTLLSAMYFGGAVEEGHHGHEHDSHGHPVPEPSKIDVV